MKHVTPDWFKKSAVYQINPRTFCEEGTIKAVTKELPKLAELGFKIMYLCPIFEEDASDEEGQRRISAPLRGSDRPLSESEI